MPLSKGPFLPSPGWLANCWLTNWPLYTEGRQGIKKRGRLFQMKGWAVFINKETYYDTYLRCQKKRRSPHPPARILEVWGLVVYFVQMVSTTHCIVSWKKTPTVGTVGRIYIPWKGEGVRSLQLPGSSSCPFDDLP